MAPKSRPPLTVETLRRLAREQAGIVVADRDAEPLLALVNDLQAEARRAAEFARPDLEPATEFALERWARV